MKKTFQILILIFLSFVLPTIVLANDVIIENPLDVDSFEDIINKIIDFIFNIALVLAPLMIVWAGGLYITSGGNPDKITKARNIIIYTLTGFAVILLSKGFVVIIKQLLGA
jgi:hypothetical protein